MPASGRRNSAKRDARAADVQERRKRALELRKQSLTLRQIATKMACAVSVVHAYIHDAIADIPVEDAKDVRAIELLKLDKLERIVRKRVVTSKGDPQAVGAWIKVMERRAKLTGADAPAKIDHSGAVVVAEATPAEARRVMAELFDKSKAPPSDPERGA